MDETEDLTTDVLMTLHLGLIHLEGGNLERAVAAGNYLCNTLSTEPDFDNKLFLRLNPDNTPIVEFDSAMKPFMVVEKSLPEQLYFMLGYPIAYLVLLFDNTKDKKYLEAAKVYANFALQCNQSIFSSNFSHKVGWGLSLLYKYNPEERYIKAIERIGDHFKGIQGEEGIWYYPDDVNTAFDQSAEITLWMTEITKNLKK